MNLQQERIALLCNVLKLDRIGSEWPAIAQYAAAQDNSHGDFLGGSVLFRPNNQKVGQF